MPLAVDGYAKLISDIKDILDNPPVFKDPVGNISLVGTDNMILNAWSEIIASWLTTAVSPPFVVPAGGPLVARSLLQPAIFSALSAAAASKVPGVNSFEIGIKAGLVSCVPIIAAASAATGLALNVNVLSFATVKSTVDLAASSGVPVDNTVLATSYATDFLKWTLYPGASFTPIATGTPVPWA
jgi:hypothetical protein